MQIRNTARASPPRHKTHPHEKRCEVNARQARLAPDPILDERGLSSLDALAERYRALNERGPIADGAVIAGLFVPNEAKDAWGRGKRRLFTGASAHHDLYDQTIAIVGRSFDKLEQQAGKDAAQKRVQDLLAHASVGPAGARRDAAHRQNGI